MAKIKDEKIQLAHDLFKQGKKLIEIASQLNIPEGTVRCWKNRYKWGDKNATLQSKEINSKDNRNVAKRKRGGQPGNKNATGPPGNQHARKHGLLAKYLPKNLKEIVDEIPNDPIEILWQNIQIHHANIINAQKYMTASGVGSLTSLAVANQALSSMVRQYREMVEENDLATEEQKARISLIKAQINRIKGVDEAEAYEDDGFIEALNGKASIDWSDNGS